MQVWGKLGKPSGLGHFTLGWSELGEINMALGVYQRRRTKQGKKSIHMRYTWPKNPQTQKQQDWRQIFADAMDAWKNLTDAEKEVYNNARYPEGMNGHNRFVREYLQEHRSP